jgi:hypothetical protein
MPAWLDLRNEPREKINKERSRKIFANFSPQILWITLFIRRSCHENTAHFFIGNRSLPKK